MRALGRGADQLGMPAAVCEVQRRPNLVCGGGPSPCRPPASAEPAGAGTELQPGPAPPPLPSLIEDLPLWRVQWAALPGFQVRSGAALVRTTVFATGCKCRWHAHSQCQVPAGRLHVCTHLQPTTHQPTHLTLLPELPSPCFGPPSLAKSLPLSLICWTHSSPMLTLPPAGAIPHSRATLHRDVLPPAALPPPLALWPPLPALRLIQPGQPRVCTGPRQPGTHSGCSWGEADRGLKAAGPFFDSFRSGAMLLSDGVLRLGLAVCA